MISTTQEKIRILVTGCFDRLHPGHLQFIENAAKYGDELYVGVCSDENVMRTKNRAPLFNEQERLYMVQSLKWVTDAALNTGSGKTDFENVIQQFKPHILIVNEDGDRPEKLELCLKYNMQYIVLKRESYRDLPIHSTTAILEAENEINN